MAMNDNIYIEIKSGRISSEFYPRDLLRVPANLDGTRYTIGDDEYKIVSIPSNLNNLSIGPGDRQGAQVKKGRDPHYRKHDNGTFTLIYSALSCSKLPDMNSDSITSENGAESIDCKYSSDIVYKDFAEYIRRKPFQFLDGRGTWYPDSAVYGWDRRLTCYSWPTNNPCNWKKTEGILTGFCMRISALLVANLESTSERESAAESIYNDIRAWGNPRGTDRPGSDVLNALQAVFNKNVSNDIPIDSTLTKLYAFTLPNEYVIYDSRVACAIVSIAEDIYRRDRINMFTKLFPYLGHMDSAASSGTRPRGHRYKSWPNAYKSWDAQNDANRLCIGIKNYLNNSEMCGKSNWTLREVEAVLFMEGY